MAPTKTTTSPSEIVANVRKAFISLINGGDELMLQAEKKRVNASIRVLSAMGKKEKTLGGKQHILSSISIIKGFKSRMQSISHTMVRGSGLCDKHRKPENASNRVKWMDLKTAFAGRMRTGTIINLKHLNPQLFMNDAFILFRRRINNILKTEFAVKVNSVFYGDYILVKGDDVHYEIKYFTTKNSSIYQYTDLQSWFTESVINPILKDMDEFSEKDSGWALAKILNLNININFYNTMKRSSYIPLPPQILLKQACINVRNNDQYCFCWSVVAALHQCSHHTDRMSSYPHYSTILNTNKIQFPMTLNQIPKFEILNNISINVYAMQRQNRGYTVYPARLTKEKKDRHINLLLVQNRYVNNENEDETDMDLKPIRYHYVWIKNLSRLVSTQLHKRHCGTHICDRCMHYFYSEEKLQAHTVDCANMNKCKIRMPTKHNTILQFKNYYQKENVPFIIYADMESLLQESTENIVRGEFQQHIPYSIGYYVKCAFDDSLSFYKSHRGPECISWFTNELRQFAEDVETVFLCPLPMDTLTKQQEEGFIAETFCHICEKPFNEGDIRVKDHCHMTGRYRGSAHNDCNINYQDSRVVPVVFHNLSGYDGHFIIKNISTDFEGRVDLLPINKEKYISFTKHIDENLVKFRFIDSYRFLSESLDKLAGALTEYRILETQFPSKESVKLLTRKGVLPYDYISEWSKLDDTKLPTMDQFYSKLNNCNITQEDYDHAQEVWAAFDCRSLGEYSDIYLKTDVILLAEVFETFRRSCLKTHKLDVAHSYTLSGYTWQAMLKYTGIQLELLTDIDMVMFIERGVRGGLSQCTTRYAEANNKYMKTGYDPSKPTKSIQYLDINNLYGKAMVDCLPQGGFRWVENPENLNFNVADDANIGYILEVKLEYPKELFKAHSDLPFCPEHLCLDGSKEKKLMATLYDKDKYVIHYRYLKMAIQNGLILKKIYRALEFRQSPWLKSYIELNTELRNKSITDFEKNLFKLLNNAVFGKTLENVRNHSVMKLITKWEGRYNAEAWISSPLFKNSVIYNENLVLLELNKSEIYYNKPLYVGMAILDISKISLYDFHYNYIKLRFGDKAKLCYTDTDSLLYVITDVDFFIYLREDAAKYFDTSDFEENNIYGIERLNKKILGYMKVEFNGKILLRFAGVKSKAYAIDIEGMSEEKKLKGIKKSVLKKSLDMSHYIDCIFKKSEHSVSQNLIRSLNHNVSTITQHKVALTPDDTKRKLCENGIDTLPHGYTD